MQSKCESTNLLEPDPLTIPRTMDPTSTVVTQTNTSNSSSPGCPNGGSESNDYQSLSNGSLNEEDDGDDVTPGSQRATPQQSVGNYGQEHHSVQHAASDLPTTRDECLTQPQLQLVGHSIACSLTPYQDPYYAGMMTAYGHPLGYPHFVGMPQARVPLPPDMAQEPVYVNAKQYQGILRRRQARAKAELEKKLIKVRKPYLHESRHRHAMRRPRCNGGRFAKKTRVNEENGTDSRPAVSSHFTSPSGSEPLHSDSAETWNSSNSQRQAQGPRGSGNSQNHGGSRTSPYDSHLCEREERDCSVQHRGSISSNGASHQPFAIQ